MTKTKDTKIMKIKFNPALYLADELLDVLQTNACTLFEDKEYKMRFDALYKRVQEMLDIGEWIGLKDFYFVIEKIVQK